MSLVRKFSRIQLVGGEAAAEAAKGGGANGDSRWSSGYDPHPSATGAYGSGGGGVSAVPTSTRYSLSETQLEGLVRQEHAHNRHQQQQQQQGGRRQNLQQAGANLPRRRSGGNAGAGRVSLESRGPGAKARPTRGKARQRLFRQADDARTEEWSKRRTLEKKPSWYGLGRNSGPGRASMSALEGGGNGGGGAEERSKGLERKQSWFRGRSVAAERGSIDASLQGRRSTTTRPEDVRRYSDMQQQQQRGRDAEVKAKGLERKGSWFRRRSAARQQEEVGVNDPQSHIGELPMQPVPPTEDPSSPVAWTNGPGMARLPQPPDPLQQTTDSMPDAVLAPPPQQAPQTHHHLHPEDMAGVSPTAADALTPPVRATETRLQQTGVSPAQHSTAQVLAAQVAPSASQSTPASTGAASTHYDSSVASWSASRDSPSQWSSAPKRGHDAHRQAHLQQGPYPGRDTPPPPTAADVNVYMHQGADVESDAEEPTSPALEAVHKVRATYQSATTAPAAAASAPASAAVAPNTESGHQRGSVRLQQVRYDGQFQTRQGHAVAHGWGREKHMDGSEYIGQFAEGAREGFGVLYTSETKRPVMGIWCENVLDQRWVSKKELFVEQEFENGDQYAGDCNDNMEMEGIGEYLFNGGAARYTGQFKECSMHGFGSLMDAQGGLYNGQFREGMREGAGIYFYPDGSYYVGQWDNDEQNGRGKLVLASGDVYIGSMAGNKRHGQGEMHYGNGDLFQGAFFGDRRHGRGRFTYADGTMYLGDYDHGQRSGEGTVRYSNGSEYTGQWQRNKRHGTGRYNFAKGGFYDGEWQNDQFHGQGALYKLDEENQHIWLAQQAAAAASSQPPEPGPDTPGAPPGGGFLRRRSSKKALKGAEEHAKSLRRTNSGLLVQREVFGTLQMGIFSEGKLVQMLQETHQVPMVSHP